MTLQQANAVSAGSAVDGAVPAGAEAAAVPTAAGGVPTDAAFISGAGLMSPGHSFSMLTRRHMQLYGTKREHLAEVCISQREQRHPPPDRDPDGPVDHSRITSTPG